MHLRSPSGLDYGSSLPHAPYANLSHAVVHTWRLHHWFSWMFGGLYVNGTTAWAFTTGGHQGGEGCDVAAEWWIEGVYEELDALNEYFYDAGTLYFIPNASDATGAGGAPPAEGFAAPALSTFFNLSGTATAPIAGVSFEGLAFEGGAPTFMAPRGVPSGCVPRAAPRLLYCTRDPTNKPQTPYPAAATGRSSATARSLPRARRGSS